MLNVFGKHADMPGAHDTADQARRYRLLFENATDYAIIFTDPQGVITDWSAGAERLMGWTASEMIGQTTHRIFTPEDRERGGVEEEMQRALRDGAAADERTHLRRDGSRFPVSGVLTTLRQGTVYGFAKIMRDLSDREQARQELHTVSQQYKAMIEAVKDYAVFAVDAEGDIASWNDGARRMSGYDYEEAVGMPFTRLFTVEEQAQGKPQRVLEEAGRDGEYKAEGTCVRKDGTAFDAYVVLTPLKDVDGNVNSFINVTQDVTDRKRAEREREKLLEREQEARGDAEEANRAKDEFLAVVSHELRTPLTAILGWSNMLGRVVKDNPTVGEGLAVIERNARAQAQLIEDLLDLSRITSGRLRLELSSTDLAEAIDAAVAAVKIAADAKRITIAKSTDPAVPRVMVDPTRMQQVVWNLLSNAVKFTPEGGAVAVTLRALDGHLELRVTDTGEGIETELLPYVFDRFRQAEGGSARRHAGLGLGLSIVRHLVELHGGVVTAESTGRGRGAAFTVTLPVRVTSAVQLTPERRGGRRAGKDECPPSLSGARVLVVEDEPDTRAIVAHTLRECGASVTQAASAAEAVEHFRREVPDVLVSDIAMPGEDGLSLIRKVRALPTDRGALVPAIALTAFASTEDRRRTLTAGFQLHVPKPVAPMELATAVANLLVDESRDRRG